MGVGNKMVIYDTDIQNQVENKNYFQVKCLYINIYIYTHLHNEIEKCFLNQLNS